MYLVQSEAGGEPTVVPADAIAYPDLAGAKYVQRAGFAEKGVLAWVYDTFLQPDRAFLDIGAHVGTYSWTCAAKAAHVYAFECGPKTFCHLAANIAIRGLEYKITPFPFALGNTDGEATYYVRSGEGGDNGIKALTGADEGCQKVTVPVRRLDSFGLKNIGFVKMDVEGFEREVLEGAAETLRASGWPKILFESWGAHRDPAVPVAELREGVFEALRDIGYTWVPVTGVADMFIAEHPL
jgi:FkbM family methyltransferase